MRRRACTTEVIAASQAGPALAPSSPAWTWMILPFPRFRPAEQEGGDIADVLAGDAWSAAIARTANAIRTAQQKVTS